MSAHEKGTEARLSLSTPRPDKSAREKGAKGPNDNVLLMPLRSVILKMLAYDPGRSYSGVDGPCSFLYGGVARHDPGIVEHWRRTTSAFMLLVSEAVERLSGPGR